MQTFKFIISHLDGSHAQELTVNRAGQSAAVDEAYRVANERFDGYYVAVALAW